MTDSWKQNLYTAKSASEELEYYEKTAREYEDDFFKKMKYSGPEACMQSLLECEQKHGFHIPRDCKVIDVGAGTGLSGLALRRAGFTGQIDALEPSENMYALALEKNLYTQWYKDLIYPDKETTVPAASYELVISVGVFNTRSTTSGCLPEVVRMAKSGGYLSILFNKHYWDQGGFEDTLNSLVDQKVVVLLSLQFKGGYYEGNTAVSFVLKKL
ncbi:uncharacterized protein LOC134841925 [Symsagittifera roscoffensis]|uniref:uncharacterized protein LOC134841925 n=1 Tax=Symsagittifera roscoffensis TaxID=84072 RepID=UPI00307BFB98